MTKQEELDRLDAFIFSLPGDTYLRPWLEHIRPMIAADIRGDIFPTATPADTRRECTALIAAAKAAAEKEAQTIIAAATRTAEESRITIIRRALQHVRSLSDAMLDTAHTTAARI